MYSTEISALLNNIPNELLLVLGGIVVAFLTQLSKKIRNKYGYDIDPKAMAAIFALLGGVIFAIYSRVVSEEFTEKLMEFWALAFSGAVMLYELFKSIVKKKEAKTPDLKSAPQIDTYIPNTNTGLSAPKVMELFETERKARILGISFESFSLSGLKNGRLTGADLENHLQSLKLMIGQKTGGQESVFFTEGGK